jgi:hypothetical protein
MRVLYVMCFLLLASFSYAQDYYADVVFDVAADGSVTISGTTNHPLLTERSTQEYTSKNGPRWILNLSLPERFSDYVFEVRLPDGAVLNYANGKHLTITPSNDRVVVKSIGGEDTLDIVIQYSIPNKKVDYLFEIIGSLLSVALIMGVMLLAYRQGSKARVKLENDQTKNSSSITLRDGLSARQQEIIELLEKSGGSLVQKQIETALGLPKASVSRNIESLRRKGLVEKQQSGMSNIVRLSKE